MTQNDLRPGQDRPEPPASRNDLAYAVSLLIDWDRLVSLYRDKVITNVDADRLVSLYSDRLGNDIGTDRLVILLKMNFVRSYLNLSLTHTPMTISDSITLRKLCGVSIDDAIPSLPEFSRFFNALVLVDLVQVIAAETNRMLEAAPSRIGLIQQKFLPSLAVGEIAGWLFEHLGNFGSFALAQDFSKHTDPSQLTGDDNHLITGYHIICAYRKQADYENKLSELQISEAAHNAALHSKADLEKFASDLTRDDTSTKKLNSYAKYVLALSCWVSHGNVLSALSVYAEKYSSVYGSIGKSTMYKIIDVYLRGGLPALRNLENSDQSLKAGFPIAWENFFLGQILFHRPTVSRIEDLLSAILTRHPDTVIELSEIENLLDHAFSAYYIDAPHPEYGHDH